MNKRLWVIGAVLAIVSTNAGCISCGHKSYAMAWERGPECDLPVPCRGSVYVFMVHGATPTTENGLETLRTKLAESGFAKVGVGELASAPCIAGEIKRIHACEPEARFVLVGYDFGAAAAVCLARDLTAKAIPVEAVVLLDPLACGKPCGLRTLLITSGTTTSSVPHTDRVFVPDTNHHKLPAHPTTVAAITTLLNEIALSGYQPVGETILAWSYPHAPEMRPRANATGSEWDFLADQPSSPQPINVVKVETIASETRPRPAIGGGTVWRTMPTPLPVRVSGTVSTSAGAVMLPTR